MSSERSTAHTMLKTPQHQAGPWLLSQAGASGAWNVLSITWRTWVRILVRSNMGCIVLLLSHTWTKIIMHLSQNENYIRTIKMQIPSTQNYSRSIKFGKFCLSDANTMDANISGTLTDFPWSICAEMCVHSVVICYSTNNIVQYAFGMGYKFC